MKLEEVFLDGDWGSVLEQFECMNLTRLQLRGNFGDVKGSSRSLFRWYDVLAQKNGCMSIEFFKKTSQGIKMVKLRTRHRLARILIGRGPEEDEITRCFDFWLRESWKVERSERRESFQTASNSAEGRCLEIPIP